VLRPDYPITTQRLQLRPYAPTDLDDVYDIHSRPEVMRFLYQGPLTREQAVQLLERKMRGAALLEQGDTLSLAVVLPEAGAVIGDVILHWTSSDHRQGEIGYVFSPRIAGRGYATEAAAVMLRIGFDQLGLHRIIGRLDARNSASARVLQRLGMRQEAHFRQNELVKGEWTDEAVYAILASEWFDAERARGAS
jgi:RimJ/RimL family protein N-acetyltransferase